MRMEADCLASGFLDVAESAALGPELARLGISGGAVYDALVGAVARQQGRGLVSGDARARPVYESLGVAVEDPAARAANRRSRPAT